MADDAGILVLGDTLLLSNADTVYAIALETGMDRRLAPIGFQGDESPRDIDSLEEGCLLLIGRQNLARINRNGTIGYCRYHQAPEASFWEQLGAEANFVNAPSYTWSARLQEHYFIFTAQADTAGKKGFYLVMLGLQDGKELGGCRSTSAIPLLSLTTVRGRSTK